MTITKSKLNKWHNAFENLNSVLPSPQLSVGAPALGSDRSQVADLPAQLVQPGHLLLRKAVAGVFHFQQLDAMTLGAPHHQVREAHSAVSEVHGKTPRTPLRTGPQTGHTILSLWREENDPSWQERPACLPEPATRLPPRPSGSLQGWAFLQMSGIQSMKIDR